MHLQGTIDEFVAFEEGAATRDSLVASLNMEAMETLSQDDAHSHVRHSNADGLVYEWVQHDYGGALVGNGHCFPGSNDPSGETGQFFSFACSEEAAFDWGELVMQFFLDHPRAPQ